ncbi:MAG: DMT family transporter [Phycisphaerales bacterium]|jgi:drug/metabolite transporter (DMT)-like permease
MSDRRSALGADAMLLAASVIWGAAFVAQRAAAEHLDAWGLAAARFVMGGVLLLPLVVVRWRSARARHGMGLVVLGGLAAGSVMLVAFVLQQRGIEAGASASSAGFITGLYVLFVPMLGLLAGVRTHAWVWCGAIMATTGLYLLSVQDGLVIGRGDLLVLACAAAWAVHVLIIGRFSPRCDPLELAAMQFLATGVLAAVLAESMGGTLPSWHSVQAAWWPLLYLGPVAVGVAFTLQVVGQRTAPPADAAVILSMEGLFAALFGALLANERLSGAQYAGCGLMLVGILVAQWPDIRPRRGD